MDGRLLPLLSCPACHGYLTWEGEVIRGRIIEGFLSCTACSRVFRIQDDVAFLALEETDRSGAMWGDEWAFARQEVYQRLAVNAERRYCTDVAWRGMVDTALGCRGLVVDVATGPGGSVCVPYLRQATSESLFVLSDLAEPIVRGQRGSLGEAGLEVRPETGN